MPRAYGLGTLAAFAALAVSAACSGGAAPLSTAAAVSGAVLPFVENDFPAALAEARSRNRPLFVEVWAPW